MKYAAKRVLAKNGNSYTVVIPRMFLMQMCLYRGVPLDLEYDDETETLTIRRGEPKPAGIYGRMAARAPRPVL